MVYLLASEEGALGDFANGLGLNNFREWLKTQNAPVTQDFLDQGWTDNLGKLRTELAFVRTTDSGVQDSLDALRSAAKRAKDVLILSNGETDNEDDGEWTQLIGD